jgi:hypothetical protein
MVQVLLAAIDPAPSCLAWVDPLDPVDPLDDASAAAIAACGIAVIIAVRKGMIALIPFFTIGAVCFHVGLSPRGSQRISMPNKWKTLKMTMKVYE